MGTFLEIKLAVDGHDNASRALKDIEDAFILGKDMEAALSLYDKNSELSRFNQHEYGVFKASNIFMELLEISLFVHSVTEGAFDPSIKPVVERWGFYDRGLDAPPSDEELLLLLASVGMDKLEIDEMNGTVLKHANIQLDFGGIGKGFAVDKMSGLLIDRGHDRFIVNLGGDIYVASLYDETPWRIGIKDPKGKKTPYAVINTRNKGVATSASYYNFQQKGNIIYSHIICPFTGSPVDHRSSVTIIADSSALADGLSTAFAVLGPGRAKDVGRKLPDIYGLIILTNEKGYEEYSINDIESLIY